MRYDDYSVVDFEAEKINNRPAFPPKPVGVALQWPGGKREYLAWGHPEGNNCDITTARSKIKDCYQAKKVLFHHAAFDMDIGECHLALPQPANFEDTLFLSFLKDPHAQELGLKEMAAKHLGMPATEQAELRDWILANVPEARRAPTKWGAYIARAPGPLVGKYARGDVKRTYKIYESFMPEIRKRGMYEAYQREKKCVPITLEMERSGICVDQDGLNKARKVFTQLETDVCIAIARRLGIKPRDMKSPTNKKGFNVNSGQQLAEAMLKADKLERIVRTPSKKIATGIEVLRACCNDKKLVNLLSVRSVATKYRGTFIEPWLEQAELTGGRILPKFNQVRGYNEGAGGARSGRYSSSDPNLQNIPTNPEESSNRETLLYLKQVLLDDYGYNFLGMRDYIIPDEGMLMLCVDYDQQEFRILAHFEQGVLMQAYLDDPNMDVHEFGRQLVRRMTGRLWERKHIKSTMFGITYGMGIKKLAARLGVSEAEARLLKRSVMKALPGIPGLMKGLQYLADHDKPLITWGGRQYFCEEPKYNEEREDWQTFEYKMLNYKIQPSAADCTKQGMINVHEAVPQARIAVQVHDELMLMVRKTSLARPIVQAMCDIKMNVPMTATAKATTKSWARVEKLAA